MVPHKTRVKLLDENQLSAAHFLLSLKSNSLTKTTTFYHFMLIPSFPKMCVFNVYANLYKQQSINQSLSLPHCTKEKGRRIWVFSAGFKSLIRNCHFLINQGPLSDSLSLFDSLRTLLVFKKLCVNLNVFFLSCEKSRVSLIPLNQIQRRPISCFWARMWSTKGQCFATSMWWYLSSFFSFSFFPFFLVSRYEVPL